MGLALDDFFNTAEHRFVDAGTPITMHHATAAAVLLRAGKRLELPQLFQLDFHDNRDVVPILGILSLLELDINLLKEFST